MKDSVTPAGAFQRCRGVCEALSIESVAFRDGPILGQQPFFNIADHFVDAKVNRPVLVEAPVVLIELIAISTGGVAYSKKRLRAGLDQVWRQNFSVDGKRTEKIIRIAHPLLMVNFAEFTGASLDKEQSEEKPSAVDLMPDFENLPSGDFAHRSRLGFIVGFSGFDVDDPVLLVVQTRRVIQEIRKRMAIGLVNEIGEAIRRYSNGPSRMGSGSKCQRCQCAGRDERQKRFHFK